MPKAAQLSLTFSSHDDFTKAIRYLHFVTQLVELKNGETYNGHMVQCDSWMNVRLREVICTSKASQGYLKALCHNCTA